MIINISKANFSDWDFVYLYECDIDSNHSHGGIMFRNYIKTAVRNLLKRKSFSLINIAGLALGMAVSFLILLYILNEVTYDRFHENSSQLYRLSLKIDAQGRHLQTVVPAPFGPALVEQFPEVTNAGRLRVEGRKIISYEDNLFEESRFYYADTGIIDIFSIPVVSGNPETMLEAPFSLVITEEMKEKYFGGKDPIARCSSWTIRTCTP